VDATNLDGVGIGQTKKSRESPMLQPKFFCSLESLTSSASDSAKLPGHHSDARCGCCPSEIGVGRCQRQTESHGKRQVRRVVDSQIVFLCEDGQFEKFGRVLRAASMGRALSRVRKPSI
jgi:hypothetical protein